MCVCGIVKLRVHWKREREGRGVADTADCVAMLQRVAVAGKRRLHV